MEPTPSMRTTITHDQFPNLQPVDMDAVAQWIKDHDPRPGHTGGRIVSISWCPFDSIGEKPVNVLVEVETREGDPVTPHFVAAPAPAMSESGLEVLTAEAAADDLPIREDAGA